MKIALAVLLTTGVASASPPTLVGRWHVVGCATSPKDPANCAQGKIVFEAKRWSVELPCCKSARAYVVVSSAKDRIKIASDGTESEIRLDADGTAHWNPRIGGRVGELSFVRDAPSK